MKDEKVKVLYVDDEPFNIMLFENLFRKKYKVISASSGEEGMHILAENSDVRVVVSDMNMPGMTGLEFVSKAKKVYDKIHFFILTGYEITPEITSALETGLIIKYFKKPFNTREIDDSITSKLSS